MLNKIKAKIKWSWKRFKLKHGVGNKSRNPKMNDIESKAIDITKTYINDPLSELIISPDDGRCFIKNDENYVILSNSSLLIINGIYHYEIDITAEQKTFLYNRFMKKYERRFNDMIKTIDSRISNSLSKISDKLKK